MVYLAIKGVLSLRLRLRSLAQQPGIEPGTRGAKSSIGGCRCSATLLDLARVLSQAWRLHCMASYYRASQIRSARLGNPKLDVTRIFTRLMIRGSLLASTKWLTFALSYCWIKMVDVQGFEPRYRLGPDLQSGAADPSLRDIHYS